MMHRIHSRIVFAAFVAVALLVPVAVRGQSVAQLPIGARLRVETDSAKITGTLENVSADSIKLRTRLDLRAVSLADTKSIWMSTGPGRARGMLKGAVPAGIVGALAGAGLSYLTWEPCKPGHIYDCAYAPTTRSRATLQGGAAIGALSMLIGGVVGAIAGSETWASVSLH